MGRIGALLAVLAAMFLTASAKPVRAIAFDVSFIDDASASFGNRGWLSSSSLFQQNLFAGLNAWGSLIDSSVTLSLRVIADNSLPRTGAQYSNGRRVGIDGPGGFGTGLPIWEPGPITKIKTGRNPANGFGEPDIQMQINASFVQTNYWFDPTPADRSEPTNGKTDFQWVVMHELGHGLGMVSNRLKNPPISASNTSYGDFFADYLSLFDSLTHFGGDGQIFDSQGRPNPMFFDGVAAGAINGGEPVPLLFISAAQNASGANAGLGGANFDHLGSCTGPEFLSVALMRACYSPGSDRPGITPIDIAILHDLGIPFLDAAAEVPEPSGALIVAVGAAALLRLRGRRRAFTLENAGANLHAEVATRDALIGFTALGGIAAVRRRTPLTRLATERSSFYLRTVIQKRRSG